MHRKSDFFRGSSGSNIIENCLRYAILNEGKIVSIPHWFQCARLSGIVSGGLLKQLFIASTEPCRVWGVRPRRFRYDLLRCISKKMQNQNSATEQYN